MLPPWRLPPRLTRSLRSSGGPTIAEVGGGKVQVLFWWSRVGEVESWLTFHHRQAASAGSGPPAHPCFRLALKIVPGGVAWGCAEGGVEDREPSQGAALVGPFSRLSLG